MSLQALFQQSQQLAHDINPAQLPAVALGLDQIEQTSRKLVQAQRGGQGQGQGQGDAQAQGQYLFASRGINPSNLKSQISAISSASHGLSLLPSSAISGPPIPLADTDIPAFRTWAHETLIVRSIEDARRRTQAAIQGDLRGLMAREWRETRRAIVEEMAVAGYDEEGQAQGGVGMGVEGQESKLQSHGRMMVYDRVVERLNECRKEQRPFGFITYMRSKVASGVEAKSPLLAETYLLLSRIAHEALVDPSTGAFSGTPIHARQYASAYALPASHTSRAELTRRIVAGARVHLEAGFEDHLGRFIAVRQAEAKLGGEPGVRSRVRAYTELMVRDKRWTNLAEPVNGEPFWAHVFLLLRTGHGDDALELVERAGYALSQRDRPFVALFRKWYTSADQRLLKDDREQILGMWNKHVKHTLESGDPFRYALYKLVGRIELERKNVKHVTGTLEDWMWFQLHMVKEAPAGGAGEDAAQGGRSYTLKDLGDKVVELGPDYFLSAGTQNNPLVYFQNLVFTGQFEEAISFLHDRSMFYIDAVHMAIALHYYGLLRLPSLAQATESGIISRKAGPDGPQTRFLNFPRLIQRYIRQFASTDPKEALQYIYLLSLGRDLPAPVGPEQQQICLDMIKKVVLDTKNYTLLLGEGSGDADITTSIIGKDLALVTPDDPRAFLRSLISEAVQQPTFDLPLPDQVQLYKQAGDDARVLYTLARYLSEAMPQATTPSELQQPDDQAQYVQGELDKMDADRKDVSQGIKRTLVDLLKYRQVKRATESGRYQEALQIVTDNDLLPLDRDVHGISQAVNVFREKDELVTRNIDKLLMQTMECLSRLFQEQKGAAYGGVSRQERMQLLKKRERALMMFAGQVRQRLDPETYQTLARQDAFF